jgi:hypothetical protein
MSEVTDLVLPILQKVQADIGEVKRDVADLKRELAEVKVEHGQRFDDMEIYLAYATGLASQSKADVKSVRSEVTAIKQRLEALETNR